MPAPTSARSSPTTAARTGRQLGTGLPTVAVWQTRPGHAAPHDGGRARTVAARIASATRRLRPRRSCSRRSTRASRSARRATCQYTITLQEHRQRPTRRASTITDPIPDQHELRVRRTTAARYSNGTVTWSGLSIPLRAAASSVHLTVEHRRRPQEEGDIDHERRHEGHVGGRAVHDRLARGDARSRRRTRSASLRRRRPTAHMPARA